MNTEQAGDATRWGLTRQPKQPKPSEPLDFPQNVRLSFADYLLDYSDCCPNERRVIKTSRRLADIRICPPSSQNVQVQIPGSCKGCVRRSRCMATIPCCVRTSIPVTSICQSGQGLNGPNHKRQRGRGHSLGAWVQYLQEQESPEGSRLMAGVGAAGAEAVKGHRFVKGGGTR